MSEPVELDHDTCLDLLTGSVVGRVAVCTPDGPHIIPVNYAVIDGSVVFRTTPYSVLGANAWIGRLAFEIDHLDHERRKAWSVVAHGRGEMVEDAGELAAVRAIGDPQPWAAGNRALYVRLRWTTLTGRRLGSGWGGRDELPLRRLV
jgi:nitroimidazol reductase NimA-like FMN-containing flavoprotein (pyridoxamine 5'-phosphate oxidase superfamily)